MKRLLEHVRYLILIGVASLLVASLAAFVWGAIKTVLLLGSLLSLEEGQPDLTFQFILVVDSILIATTLLIFSLSLYELFVGPLDNVPEWLIVCSLADLKVKLSSMMVLIMGVRFLETLLHSPSSNDLLRSGIATAVVSAALIAYGALARRE
ncbi:YqhA family protein [Myxococcota bacterium]|jgi:uncharacterized membrane protein YqhA|nr:YqhA family protein [Myxococcota bacterium]